MNLLNKSLLSSFSDPSKIAFVLLLALPAVCAPAGAAALPSLAELRGWLDLSRVKGAASMEVWLAWWWCWWTCVLLHGYCGEPKWWSCWAKAEPSARGKEKQWDVVLCTPAFTAFTLRADLWAAQPVSRRWGAVAAGRGAARAVQELSGAAACSSLPLQQSSRAGASSTSQLPSRAGCFSGKETEQWSWAGPQSKTCWLQPCVTSSRWMGIQWLGLSYWERKQLKRHQCQETKPGSSAISLCSYFDVCKLHGFAGQIQMLNSRLAQERLELWGHTCPGVNRAGLGKPLRMPCCLARVSQGDQAACGWAGGCCAASKSQERAQSVVKSLETSSGEVRAGSAGSSAEFWAGSAAVCSDPALGALAWFVQLQWYHPFPFFDLIKNCR